MTAEIIQNNTTSPTHFMLICKCFLLTVLFFCSSLVVFSQDIITKKDGTEIQAKVLEIGTSEVKYTRFGTTSPTYIVLKSDVSMIKYEDGTKDVFNEEEEENTQQQPNTDNPLSSDFNQEQIIYRYTFGNQINPIGGRKSEFGSGIASLFIPGLGQFINGDVGGGFLFLSFNFATNCIRLTTEDEDIALGALLSNLAINIFSIINAVQIAKRVNLARGYELGNNTYLKVEPALLKTNNFAQQNINNPACGMSLQLTF